MKIKIIVLNFTLIIWLFLIFDFCLFNSIENKYSHDSNNIFHWNLYIKASKIKQFDDTYKKLKSQNYFRNTIQNTNKPPILILGCSFGYGYLLEENQAFTYKLATKAERSVYNQSISSLGVQYFPYILEKFEINKEVKDPEYIIFVFIENHINRLYRYFSTDNNAYLDIRYKETPQGLKEIKHKYYIFEHSAIIRYLQNKYAEYKYNHNSYDKNFDFMKLHFLKAQKLAKEKFPNSKIVILKYEENPDSWYYNTERWNELEKQGFIIIGSYELTGKHLYENEYRIKNDVHPNEKAWDLLVPKLVKKLNL